MLDMQIDLMNPFQGRKWLSLFESNNVSAIRLKPNLKVPKSNLGFSASTNKYGLRGPSNPDGEAVICGTSFAMGMCVDDGKNWYELGLDSNRWINFGLPVGPSEHMQMIEEYYNGEFKTLLYIYHPNLWSLALRYNELDYRSGESTFEQLGWKTDLLSSCKIYLKRLVKNRINLSRGHLKYIKMDNQSYRLDSRYFYFDPIKNEQFIKSQIAIIKNTFEKFEKVVIVRVPVKEECAEGERMLDKLISNYDFLFDQFVSEIQANPKIKIYDFSKKMFSLSDYHPLDNHWNSKGNYTFATGIGEMLNSENLNHLLLSK